MTRFEPRDEPAWQSEDQLLTAIRALWEHSFVADSARVWMRSPGRNATARLQAAELLRVIAGMCDRAALSIKLGGTDAGEESMLLDKYIQSRLKARP